MINQPFDYEDEHSRLYRIAILISRGMRSVSDRHFDLNGNEHLFQHRSDMIHNVFTVEKLKEWQREMDN
jgi:hypothetical protein